MNRIYLDYNASTPVDPEVFQAMVPYLTDSYGNPSSAHWAAEGLQTAIERARASVARLLNASSEEVVFTSGGSEANNHVLQSAFFANRLRGNHIITSKIEHPSILRPCAFLESIGATVTYVDVDKTGRVNPADIEAAITDKTILITIMHANNETGTIQPIREIAAIADRYGILMHTDAAQSVGKVVTDVQELGVHYLTMAGHKLYAPKGVGALYMRSSSSLPPFVHGAGHERGRRAGTENVPYVVALGKAAKLAFNHSQAECKRIRHLTHRLLEGLSGHFQNRIVLHGHPVDRLPNTLNVSFVGHTGQNVLRSVPEIAASTGSACHTGKVLVSPVLQAMGVEESIGMGTVRLSLGRYTSEDEIEKTIKLLTERIR